MKLKKLLIFISAFALSSCDLLSFLNNKTEQQEEGETQTKTEEKEEPGERIVAIKAHLNVTSYFIGDTFNTASLSATLTRSDQTTTDYQYSVFATNGITTKLINPNGSEVSLNDTFNVAGSYTVKLSTLALKNSNEFIEDSTSFQVKPREDVPVILESLAIHLEKTHYYEFENLDLSGLSVTLHYSNNEETVSYANFAAKECTVALLNSNSQQIPLDSELEIGTYRLVVSCGNVSDSIQLTVAEESYVIGGEVLSSLHNELTFVNNEYVSNENRALKLFDNYFNSGIYQAQISVTEQGFDNHLIFGYNSSDESYYSFGINMKNKPQITYFNGTNLYLLKSFNEVATNNSTFAVCFDQESGSADFYINNSFVYSRHLDTNGNLKYGLYAGSKGCTFSNVMTNADFTLFDSNFENYQTAHGSCQLVNGNLNVQSAQFLNYNKTKTFKHGEMEVVFNANNANSTVGIVFCMDNNGRTSFYREIDVSYYYLAITVNGTVGLYRVKGGSAALLKNINTKNYYLENDHVMKVVRDNNKVIHAFLDGAYCFSYVDQHPLAGDKFGVTSTSSVCLFKKILVKTTFNETNESIVDYDVVSGSFYKNNDLIVSDANNSMLIKKTPGALNGTIEAEIALGRDYESGFVFRLSKPNSETFYENESGLSYYYLDVRSSNRINLGRYSNGSVTWVMQKYMPSFMSHGAKVKIVMKDNEIYAYFSNILVFHYTDNNPLTGLYYGVKSQSKGVSLKGDITFKASTEIETNQYLIFGHSYTQLWHHYKDDFAELGEDINDIGIGGSQTITWSDQYQEETSCYNPEWGIYWNGINDVDADITLENIITRYKACLNYIKSKVPNFKCVCLSIARCAHEKALERFEQIANANAAIKEYCDQNDWLVYVDVEKIFCDNAGNPIESYFVDKLHPTVQGYRLVAPLVVDAIKNF